MDKLIILVLVLALLVYLGLTSLCVVPQGSNWVVERLGKYHHFANLIVFQIIFLII